MASSNKEMMSRVQKELNLIQDKTGFNPKIIVGVLGAALLGSMIGCLGPYITCVVGIALPLFWSIKAIESNEKDDDKQWLTYWAVYACFTFFDLFATIIEIIPFYFFIKLTFLIWCFMPNTMGALFIYNNFIKRFFKTFEKQFDSLAQKVMQTGEEVGKKAKEVIQENQENIMNAGLEAAKQINKATAKLE